MMTNSSSQPQLTNTLQVAAMLVVQVYEKISGNQYNKDDRLRLKKLCDCYEDSFGIAAPSVWALDAKHCPTHVLQKTSWYSHVKQLRAQKYHSPRMNKYIKSGLRIISCYLDERSGSGWLLRGSKGDIVEQFFADLINFFLNDLPSEAIDDAELIKIQKRIDYLGKVISAEKLFEYSVIAIGKDKMSVIFQLKDVLAECLSFAKQESERTAARDKFCKLENELKAIMYEASEWIYYSRKTDVKYESFQLMPYIQLGTLTKEQQVLYQKLWETHTGSILKEIILISGVDCFGDRDLEVKNEFRFKYFVKGGVPIKIELSQKNIDFPDWLLIDAYSQVEKTQQIGAQLIKLSKLIKLVGMAYDLTGDVGQLWAYGDLIGKSSLSDIIVLLKTILFDLFGILTPLSETRKTRQEENIRENRINSESDSNPNFHHADDCYKEMKIIRDRIFMLIKSIQDQMDKFPADSERQINRKKSYLYNRLFEFIQKEVDPKLSQQLTFCRLYEPTFLVESATEATATPIKEIKKMSKREKESKDLPKEALPLLTVPSESASIQAGIEADDPLKNFNITSFDAYVIPGEKPYFNFQETPKDPVSVDWILGDGYDQWLDGFCLRSQNEFKQYSLLVQAIRVEIGKISHSNHLDQLFEIKSSIDKKAESINSMNNHFQHHINENKPQWRLLKWMPLRFTCGWPFNRKATQFSEKFRNILIENKQDISEGLESVYTLVRKKQSEILMAPCLELDVEADEAVQESIIDFCDHCVTIFSSEDKTKILMNLNRKQLYQLVAYPLNEDFRVVFYNILQSCEKCLLTPNKMSAKLIFQVEFLQKIFEQLLRFDVKSDQYKSVINSIESYFDRCSSFALRDRLLNKADLCARDKSVVEVDVLLPEDLHVATRAN